MLFLHSLFILFLIIIYSFLTAIFFNEKCYVYNILRNTFTTKFIWKVVTSSNLNPPLKLFFYSLILTNNNLLLKIYYKNIVIVFFNYDFLFFILFFFIPFHFHPHFISFFLFSFSCFSLPHSSPSFYFLFHLKNIPALHMRERERLAWASTACISIAAPAGAPASPPPLVVFPTDWLGSDRLVLFFFSLIFACSNSTLF